MIQIDEAGAFTLFAMAWFVLLAVLWGRELWRGREQEWTIMEGSLCVCDGCHHAFMVEGDKTAARCPRCNELCVVRNRRRF